MRPCSARCARPPLRHRCADGETHAPSIRSRREERIASLTPRKRAVTNHAIAGRRARLSLRTGRRKIQNVSA